eukprot:CAMPEP_0184643720 /NCGR_PEP_ID=MMETSP0308-20130426/554_1 /TAXON_ID=38269 /ORGANISM="Gloeochaete witrockiana, Strain SAG 46.84" /LENGTH=33 /DNA_ID= /DNA_START= /DNA_END= /DNA_ORIENTATION=
MGPVKERAKRLQRVPEQGLRAIGREGQPRGGGE